MSTSKAINGSEGYTKQYAVELTKPRRGLWETQEADEFIKNLLEAEELRLKHNLPFCKQAAFEQEQDQWDTLCLPKPRNNIRTAHSLGDESTTVFISEFGELTSFSKFLGLGMQGTVLVEPSIKYGWDRREKFNHILDGRFSGVGLRLEDRTRCRDQKVHYTHDRWPRVSYKIGFSERIDDGTSILSEDFVESKSSPYHLHAVSISPGVTQELTALYSLKRYSLTKAQEQALKPKTAGPRVDVKEDNKSESDQEAPDDKASGSHSVPTGGEIDQTVPVEGYAREVLPTGLVEVVHNRLKEDERSQEDSFWDYSGEDFLNNLENSLDRDGLYLLLKREMPDRHFLSPGPQYIDVSMFLKNDYRGNWNLKPTPTNQLLRRHLQQLLHVNVLAIPRGKGLPSAFVLSEAHILCDTVPIWGSLCMFRFLLSMHVFLERPGVTEKGLHTYLKCQIKKTCERHLDWIFDYSRPLQGGWAENYNLNGSYPDTEESSWYYGAVQFIKIHEFRKVFQTLDDQVFVLQKVRKRLGPWFDSLEKLRDLKSGLWVSFMPEINVIWFDPEYRQDENVTLPEYSVAHLIILWKAFRFVFDFLDESTSSEVKYELNTLKASLESDWREAFSPSKLRTQIMEYFTYEYLPDQGEPRAHTKYAAAQKSEFHSDKDAIEDSAKSVKDPLALTMKYRKESDPIRRKQVLAFCWAGNDKPRYLWYSWGSLIFEAVNSGFFKDESMRVWKETLQAQRVHRELSWVKLSRYALGLRAAQHGVSLDMTMNAEQMRKTVCGRLLKCFYSNGTFPTGIALITKQPTCKWWEYGNSVSTFEIPLLLLQEEAKCLDVAEFLVDTAGRSNLVSPNNSTPHQGPSTVNASVECDIQDTVSSGDDLDFDLEAVIKERAGLAKLARQSARTMKVDRANIRDPPDFEPDWLFPYADCFASDDPTWTVEETTLIREDAKRTVEHLRQRSDYLEESAYRVLDPGTERYLSDESDRESKSLSEPFPFMRATVVDVSQAVRSPMSIVSSNVLNLKRLEIRLLRKRTVEAAKKRLIIIDSCQAEHALLLYLGSAESEKLSTAGFLTRHNMRESFLRDHAHKEVNLWITELHLSFYKKVTLPSRQSDPRPFLGKGFFEEPEKLSAFPGEPKSSMNRLQKGAISWRFTGDLHDRRWTGIVLAFVPGRDEDANWITPQDFEIDKRFHGQRKIIEARLFSDMGKTIYVSTKEVFDHLNNVLKEGEGGVYWGSSEHHDPFSESFDQSYSRSILYLQLSHFLSHLDDSFKSIMEAIESFTDREKQRPVQPRWSFEDERKYRSEIHRCDQQGNRNVALLRSLRSETVTKLGRVQHLRESLNADMQLREARLQARSAEDVRLFTYVTIIFLPISFAASLFSMQQAPGNALVGTFAKVAIVALVITLIILFNLKTMSRNAWTYANRGLHKISNIMRKSSWKYWADTRADLVQAEKCNITSDEPLQILRTSKWWHCLFLLIFSFVELPAIRLLLAYEVFRPPTEEDAKQRTLPKKVIRVMLGLVFLPLFVFVYATHFLLRNLIDLSSRLSSSLGVDPRNLVSGAKPSSARFKARRSLEIHNPVSRDHRKRALDRTKFGGAVAIEDAGEKQEVCRLVHEKERSRVKKENFSARVERLTHPPRPFKPSATASDKSEDARRKEGNQDAGGAGREKQFTSEEENRSEIGGNDEAFANNGNRILRVLNKLKWKASPQDSRAARTPPV